MNARLTRFVALLLALAMIATACGGGSDSGGDSADTPAANDASGDSDTDDGGSDDSSSGDAEETTDTVIEIEDDPSEDPVSGGTLRYGLEADSIGLNPTSSAMSSPGLMMANAPFETLARFNDNDEWVPYLAESFTPSDDFTSWTVVLRDGVMFHDDTPLNAEAVVVNFTTQFADPLVGLAVRPFYADPAVEVIDELTLQFNLAGPNANWPTSMTTQLGMVASPTWLALALEDATLNQEPVGTGAFKYESRNEDSVTRFVRNDNWWNGTAYLDAIEFVPVPDPDVRASLLIEGDLQAQQTTNQDSIIELQETEGIQNIIDDSGAESFVMLNGGSAPFDDIRARQALTFMTPRLDYIDFIGLGVSQPADQMFTPSSPYYNPDVVQEADMPDLAFPLIEAYCADFADNCTDGKIDMEFQWSGPSVVQTRIAELFEENWRDGFNVKFQELFQDAHIQEVAFGQYDVVTWRQFSAPNPSDDRVWLSCDTIGGISLNFARVCDEDRDAIIDELSLATTVEDRQPLLADLSANVNEAYSYIFLTHTLWNNAFAENVRGVCSHAGPDAETLRCAQDGRTWFDNVWLAETAE